MFYVADVSIGVILGADYLRIHHMMDVLVSQHRLQWNDRSTELSHPTCLSMPQPSATTC